MTLAELKPGQEACIKSIETDQPGIVRLMVLGLIEDVPVRVENAAIGGDPMEISIFGASISVRRQQASHFHLAPLPISD